jgi:hypothetical protein
MMKSRRMKYAGHIACMWAKRNACRVLMREPERKRPRGKGRRRWKNKIKIDLEIGLGGIDWTYLAQDKDQWQALVKTLINFLAPLNVEKLLNIWAIRGISRAQLRGGRQMGRQCEQFYSSSSQSQVFTTSI